MLHVGLEDFCCCLRLIGRGGDGAGAFETLIFIVTVEDDDLISQCGGCHRHRKLVLMMVTVMVRSRTAEIQDAVFQKCKLCANINSG